MLAFITDLLTKVRVSELTFSEKRGSVSYVVVAEAVRCAARAFARSCRSDLPFQKRKGRVWFLWESAPVLEKTHLHIHTREEVRAARSLADRDAKARFIFISLAFCAFISDVAAANWALRTPSSAAVKGHGHGRRWSAARWPLPAGGE